jgi:hypothetical protein
MCTCPKGLCCCVLPTSPPVIRFRRHTSPIWIHLNSSINLSINLSVVKGLKRPYFQIMSQLQVPWVTTYTILSKRWSLTHYSKKYGEPQATEQMLFHLNLLLHPQFPWSVINFYILCDKALFWILISFVRRQYKGTKAYASLFPDMALGRRMCIKGLYYFNMEESKDRI